MKLITAAILATLATPALAQQTPNEQALLAKLTSEMNSGLQCMSGLIQSTQAMEKAEKRIKELEAKYEPKPEAPPAKP